MSRCFVAGHRGLVGSAMVRALRGCRVSRPDRSHARGAGPARSAARVRSSFATRSPTSFFSPLRRSAESMRTTRIAGIFSSRISSSKRTCSARHSRRSRACGVLRQLVHLSPSGAAANQGRISAHRPARADERAVCDCEDCGSQARRSRQHAVRPQLDLADADESLRTERQLRSRDIARASRADSEVS